MQSMNGHRTGKSSLGRITAKSCRSARSDAVLSALRESPLFDRLSDADLRELLDDLRLETWTARSPAMSAAQSAERFYLIVTGRLKVMRINPDSGREVSLSLLGPGDAFDVVSLLDATPLGAATQALDDLTVVSAPLERVRAWRETYPEFDHALSRYLAQQLRSMADLASDLALYDTDIRLARLIRRHAAADGPDAWPLPIDDLSHENLASLIGSVRVVVNRHIQELKRDGIISARRGQLAVRDLQSLIRRCRQPSAPRAPRGPRECHPLKAAAGDGQASAIAQQAASAAHARTRLPIPPRAGGAPSRGSIAPEPR